MILCVSVCSEQSASRVGVGVGVGVDSGGCGGGCGWVVCGCVGVVNKATL